jgi:hypothetical protein
MFQKSKPARHKAESEAQFRKEMDLWQRLGIKS